MGHFLGHPVQSTNFGHLQRAMNVADQNEQTKTVKKTFSLGRGWKTLRSSGSLIKANLAENEIISP